MTLSKTITTHCFSTTGRAPGAAGQRRRHGRYVMLPYVPLCCIGMLLCAILVGFSVLYQYVALCCIGLLEDHHSGLLLFCIILENLGMFRHLYNVFATTKRYMMLDMRHLDLGNNSINSKTSRHYRLILYSHMWSPAAKNFHLYNASSMCCAFQRLSP